MPFLFNKVAKVIFVESFQTFQVPSAKFQISYYIGKSSVQLLQNNRKKFKRNELKKIIVKNSNFLFDVNLQIYYLIFERRVIIAYLKFI